MSCGLCSLSSWLSLLPIFWSLCISYVRVGSCRQDRKLTGTDCAVDHHKIKDGAGWPSGRQTGPSIWKKCIIISVLPSIQAQDTPRCRPSNDLELRGSQQSPHGWPRSQPSPHDSSPAPASPESGLSRCFPAKISSMIKTQAFCWNTRQSLAPLCLSANHSILHLLFNFGPLGADPPGGLGPALQRGTRLHACYWPSSCQVTGAEGSSELKGRTGSGLPRTQPGEMWVLGIPSTVLTDC